MGSWSGGEDAAHPFIARRSGHGARGMLELDPADGVALPLPQLARQDIAAHDGTASATIYVNSFESSRLEYF
jgi:hypothetical protein